MKRHSLQRRFRLQRYNFFFKYANFFIKMCDIFHFFYKIGTISRLIRRVI